jgi:zinc transport system substrate-binding protein
VDGKEPKARQLRNIIENARNKGIKVFFVDRSSPTNSALVVSRELDIDQTPINVLQEDWPALMDDIYRAFSHE